jgi:hypothetical protein
MGSLRDEITTGKRSGDSISMKKLNRYKFELEYEVRHTGTFSIVAENLEVAEEELERMVENNSIHSGVYKTPILESLDYKLLVELEQV